MSFIAGETHLLELEEDSARTVAIDSEHRNWTYILEQGEASISTLHRSASIRVRAIQASLRRTESDESTDRASVKITMERELSFIAREKMEGRLSSQTSLRRRVKREALTDTETSWRGRYAAEEMVAWVVMHCEGRTAWGALCAAAGKAAMRRVVLLQQQGRRDVVGDERLAREAVVAEVVGTLRRNAEAAWQQRCAQEWGRMAKGMVYARQLTSHIYAEAETPPHPRDFRKKNRLVSTSELLKEQVKRKEHSNLGVGYTPRPVNGFSDWHRRAADVKTRRAPFSGIQIDLEGVKGKVGSVREKREKRRMKGMSHKEEVSLVTLCIAAGRGGVGRCSRAGVGCVSPAPHY